MNFTRNHTAVVMAFVTWATLCAMVLQVLSDVPWLGARFEPNPGGGVVVQSIVRGGPADVAGLLRGDEVVSITASDGAALSLTGFEAVLGRHQTPNFDSYNATLDAKEALWPIVTQPELTMETSDGRRIELTGLQSRGLFKFQFEFALKMLNALVVALVAIGIWAFAPRGYAVTLLAISGIGLAVNILCGAILSTSELTISPSLFHLSISAASWGGATFSYALLVVIWHFPRKLSRQPVTEVLMGIGVLLQINLLFQFYEFPINSFEMAHLVPVPIALVASLLQWRNTRGKPLERASVIWFSLTIYGLVTLVVGLYSLPLVLNVPILLSPALANVFLALIFLGIALGTLRYRLFDVHRIWLRAVLWVIGGVTFILLDLGFVLVLNLEQSYALPLALLVAGWIYFPSRNKLAEWVLGARETDVSAHIPELIRRFNNLRDEDEVNGRFIGFLKSVYRVSEVASIDDIPLQEAQIENHGLFLRVPLVTEGRSALLVGMAGGRQLFSRGEVAATDTFLYLVRSLHAGNVSEVKRLEEERERITRDLHDDVGGKLLTMIYQAPDEAAANQAREALQALRETVYVVENQQTIEFSGAWALLVAELEKDLGRVLSHENRAQLTRDLSAREYVNLKRIMQEVTSNALKYAEKGSMELSVQSDAEDTLFFRFRNRLGAEAQPDLTSGRGLMNIRRRIEEMGGSVAIATAEANNGVFQLDLVMPAPTAF